MFAWCWRYYGRQFGRDRKDPISSVNGMFHERVGNLFIYIYLQVTYHNIKPYNDMHTFDGDVVQACHVVQTFHNTNI